MSDSTAALTDPQPPIEMSWLIAGMWVKALVLPRRPGYPTSTRWLELGRSFLGAPAQPKRPSPDLRLLLRPSRVRYSGPGRARLLGGEAAVSIRHPAFEGRLDLRDRLGLVWEGCINPSQEALRQLLSVLFAVLVPRTGRLLLHASGVVVGDGVVLFLGPSGAGKTTVATTLLKKEQITFSVDQVVLDVNGAAGVVAWPTPFGGAGESVGASDARLVSGAFLLHQDDHARVEALSSAQALAGIMRSVTVLVRTPDTDAAALDLTAALVEAVPMHRLHFAKSRSFWPQVLAAVGEDFA